MKYNLSHSAKILEVESAPFDESIVTEGVKKQINYFDEGTKGKMDYIALFSNNYGEQITVPQFHVAVQVDSANKVLKIVNPSIKGNPPSWEPDPVDLIIPQGGYVLLAHDNSYDNSGIRKYLSTQFKTNDFIKLRKNGELITLNDIVSDDLKPRIQLDQSKMFTVNQAQTAISGAILNYDSEMRAELKINSLSIVLSESGTFKTVLLLDKGANYIDILLTHDDSTIVTESIIAYYKSTESFENKEVFMWIDQSVNAHKFQTSTEVHNMLVKAKTAGITGIMFNVKGYEGFVSYKKNDFTGRPYVSEMSGPHRGGANPELDLLQEFITQGHSLGLEIHAAINIFAEGSMYENAVLDQHSDWEERVYRPEDDNQIVPFRQSQAPNKIMPFVNPANDEVRDYQLRTCEEVIKNYNVDGINLDRARFDNDFADFSEQTRIKFAAYLEDRGKTLEVWPDDVYKFDYDQHGQASKMEGKHFIDWWAFRSGIIKSFTAEVHDLIEHYNLLNNKKMRLSSYVASWYDTAYTHGINWASTSFQYDQRLGFAEERIYSADYYQTGYLDNFDFIMIGTYQSTKAEIERFMTLGNVLTKGEIPLYASLALSNFPKPDLWEIFQAALKQTDGIMLFDYSTAHFDIIEDSLKS